MKSVELIPASVYTCDECGRDNFVRHRVLGPDQVAAELREMAEAESEMLRAELELGSGYEVGGVFMLHPETVTCPHCRAVFATREFGAPE